MRRSSPGRTTVARPGTWADRLRFVAAGVLLVDPAGRLLLQLRDGHAAYHPNVWGLPGGQWEPGETVAEAAVWELYEETGLSPDGELRLFARQELPELGWVKHYSCGATRARQEDVVLGEGAAMLFVPAGEVLDGRPYTPGTVAVLTRFPASPEYAGLATAGR
ncbi:NUDIX domain-containing protein [Micromonospora sp. NPDC050200]|uniref:NUDIX domain-containing protein n=1 Tax=Micromonospora sp. NPDC050200 TaxID=3155664 RepID=UPI0033D51F48